MKSIFLSVLVSSVSPVWGQAWQESLSKARKAYKNHEYQKAEKLYKSAQNQAPKEVDLSKEIAQNAYRSRSLDAAETVYEQASSSTKSKDEKAKLQHNLGNTRMKKKDYAGAIEAYKESLRNNPNDEETRYNLSEAIRQKKEQEQQNKQNQQNQQNQQNKQNQNKNQQQNKGDNQQNQPQQKGNQGNDSKDSQDGKSANLPDRQSEKMLDDLTKKEAQTRQRVGKNKGDKTNSNKSGKNW